MGVPLPPQRPGPRPARHGRGRRLPSARAGGSTTPTYETALPARLDPFRRQQPDPLGAFDAVIVGDVDPADLTPEIWARLEAYVAERGGTLVLGPGPRHWAALARPGDRRASCCRCSTRSPSPSTRPRSTPRIRPSPRASPCCRRPRASDTAAWPMLQLAADPDAEPRDLVRPAPAPLGPRRPGQAGGDRPGRRGRRRLDAAVIAAQPYGLGKVLWVGTDDTWRWRHRVGDAYHHRFWGQVVRWAAASKLAAGNAFVRFGPIRPRIAEGETVRLQARISEGVAGVGPDLLVAARVFKADPRTHSTTGEAVAVVPLAAGRRPAPDVRGHRTPAADRHLRRPARRAATRRGPPPRPGRRQRSPKPRSTSSTRETSETRRAGRRPRPARPPRRAPPAAASSPITRPTQLAPLLRARTRTVSRTEETPLWDQPAALLLFFAILTVEWVARKRLGLP